MKTIQQNPITNGYMRVKVLLQRLLIILPLAAALLMTTGCGASKKSTVSAPPVAVTPEAVEEVATEVIGSQMDRQIADLERIDGVQVEAVSGDNNLKVIKVTIAEGILFATNSSELGQSSRNALTNFARSLVNHPQTNVTVHGHTDNTGTRAVNERLSDERAKSVSGFLAGQGVSSNRMTTKGFAADSPVADNSSAEGRTKNRRVEIFISADEEMIQQARATAETRIIEQAAAAPASTSGSAGSNSSGNTSTGGSGSGSGGSASSGSSDSGRSSGSSGVSSFTKGSNIVGIGAGLGGSLYSGYHFYSGYRRWPTLSLYYENCIIDNLFDAKSAIGVGGMVGYSTARWKYKGSGDPYGWRSDNIFLGARAAFHYAFIPKLDAYTGFMAGYNLHFWKWTGEYGYYEAHRYGSNGFTWSWFAGARYYFAPAIAVFGEAGYGMSLFNGGITFKF